MVVQRVPDGLEDMPPGPGLAALLASVDVARIANEDLPVVLKARSRQRSHDEAEFLRVIAQIGQRDPFAEPDTITPLPGGYEHAADELRVALFWTRRAAEATQCYADRLVLELPLVHAALAAGHIDPPKARVFEHHLINLPAEHIERICVELLPLAGERTTGQLAALLARRVISIDPARAKDQYERAVAERGVVAYLNPDGTATLAGQGLAPDEAAAASDRVHRLAKQAKRAGHPGGLEQIKADVLVGLLDGRFHGQTVQQIIAALLAAHTEPTGPPSPLRTGPPQASPPRAGQFPDGDAEFGSGRGIGIEISVELATLLDLDDHPNRRFPTATLRRHIQLRDRTCVGPGCRRPATHTDFDHTQDHQHGGPTTSDNGGACCTHDHRLKTKGGWRLRQPEPGQFVWQSALGQTHRTRGEPILDPIPHTDLTDPRSTTLLTCGRFDCRYGARGSVR
jgi:hypothetical protein